MLVGVQAFGADAGAFSRTRHKAGLLALIEYNDTPSHQKFFACKKAQLAGICRMLVQEGGYEPQRLYAILNITDPEVEYVAMLVADMEGQVRDVPRPGSMELASAVAFAYTVPSADGMRAAVHAGRLGCADEDCDAVCRAVYSLIVYAIEGKISSKDDLIKIAALNSDVERVARVIRSVRLAEWRKLPKESTLLGRLARVLFLWRRCEGFADSINMGRRKLRYPESRKLLAVLSACWTDLPYLPENFVWKALMTKDNREICAEMYNLSVEAILARVSESMVYSDPQGVVNKSVERVNGVPVSGGGQVAGIGEVTVPAVPQIKTGGVPSGLTGKMSQGRNSSVYRASPPAPPAYEELKSMENSELVPISPLEPVPEESAEMKVVRPVDMFGGSYFAE